MRVLLTHKPERNRLRSRRQELLTGRESFLTAPFFFFFLLGARCFTPASSASLSESLLPDAPAFTYRQEGDCRTSRSEIGEGVEECKPSPREPFQQYGRVIEHESFLQKGRHTSVRSKRLSGAPSPHRSADMNSFLLQCCRVYSTYVSLQIIA